MGLMVSDITPRHDRNEHIPHVISLDLKTVPCEQRFELDAIAAEHRFYLTESHRGDVTW